MSVINTMLKDLENRGGAGEAQREPVLQGLGAAAGAARRRTSPAMIAVAGVASTMAVLVAVYLLSPYRLVTDADVNARSAAAPPVQAPILDAGAGNREEAPAVVPTGTAASEKPEAKPGTKHVLAGMETRAPQTTSQEREAREEAPAAKPPAQVHTRESVPAIAAASKAELTQKNESSAQSMKAKPAGATPAPQSGPIASAQGSSAAGMQEEYGEDEEQLVVTKKQRALTAQEQSMRAYAIAMKHYKEGDRQQAKLLLREALGYDSANVAARRLLAGIHLETGQPELAQETIEAGLRKSGNDEELLRLYLQTSVKVGNYARAIAVMRKLRPSAPDELGYLAGLYQKNNDHLNAISYYSEALQIKPDQSIWWMGQGISLEALGKYNEALQSYTQSVKAGRLTMQLTEFVANRIISIEQKLEPQDS